MRQDHRPSSIKRLQAHIESSYVKHFLRPQLDSLGDAPMIMKPWYFKPHGEHIYIGNAVHIVTARDRTVRLTTWNYADHQGQIHIEDFALLCPGVRVDAATKVTVGQGTMLAANAYITDADWHDIYDRTAPIGKTQAVTLEPNVWIGDSAIVCKGVTVGENSIVGAGSVVTRDIPANVIAAGNPAVVVKPLDPSETLRTRTHLLADYQSVERDMQNLDRYLRGANTLPKWLQTVIAPKSGD